MCSAKQRLFFSPNHAARVSAQGSELEPWPTHKTYCAVDVVSSQIWKRQFLTEIKLMSAGQRKQQEKPSHRAVDVVFSQDLEAAAARPHHQRSAAVDPAGGMGRGVTSAWTAQPAQLKAFPTERMGSTQSAAVYCCPKAKAASCSLPAMTSTCLSSVGP